jgi:hypothetical protein
VDDDLAALVGHEHDDLEEVGGTVGTDDEPSIRILAEVLDCQRGFDRVNQVFIRDAVSPGGRVDLHTALLYYETRSQSLLESLLLHGLGGPLLDARRRSWTPLDALDPTGRSNATYTIFEGTSEIQRLVISRAISGIHIK